MALYVFSCDNEDCSTKKEEMFMSMKDYHLPDCPECGMEMRRVYTGVAFAFDIDFRAGFDTGLGEYCNTARQRDNYVSKYDLRRKN